MQYDKREAPAEQRNREDESQASSSPNNENEEMNDENMDTDTSSPEFQRIAENYDRELGNR